MFGIGFTELILVLIVALIFIGPDKLPDIARALGKALEEFRKAGDELKKNISEAQTEVREQERAPGESSAEKDKKKDGAGPV